MDERLQKAIDEYHENHHGAHVDESVYAERLTACEECHERDGTLCRVVQRQIPMFAKAPDAPCGQRRWNTLENQNALADCLAENAPDEEGTGDISVLGREEDESGGSSGDLAGPEE